MKLVRKTFAANGIFGELRDEAGNLLAVTLEHAYATEGRWLPKLPPGNYQCVRGPHRLHGMAQDFTTFEITGVPGHSGLLFHWGNYNKDSEGCVLLGQVKLFGMITHSRLTFRLFMESLENTATFQLEVINAGPSTTAR